jgi:hypothetical protein
VGRGRWALGRGDEAELLRLARAGRRLLTHVLLRAVSHVGRAAWVPSLGEVAGGLGRGTAGLAPVGGPAASGTSAPRRETADTWLQEEVPRCGLMVAGWSPHVAALGLGRRGC